MEKNLVGYRFHPTGEELINHYLKNKILGKSWLVDDAINEINICDYEPIFLPSLSIIESEDLKWYFFSRREFSSAKKTAAKRTTRAGYWKVTGVDRKIKDKKSLVVGIKKTIVFHQGRVPNGIRTPWVMHEYHITSLPLHQRSYVICQVMYKGEEGDLLYGTTNDLSVPPQPSHSLVSDPNTVNPAINTSPEVDKQGEDNAYALYVDDLLNGQEDPFLCDGFDSDTFFTGYNNNMDALINPMNGQGDLSPSDGFNPDTLFSDYNNNVEPQTPYYNECFNGTLDYNGEGVKDLLSSELVMQENRNNHMAKKPLTGIIVDSDDNDGESISATSYQGTNDSVGSSNRHFSSCSSTDSFEDLQTSISRKNRGSQLTRRDITSKQEVKESKSKAVYASIKRKDWFITEEATERKGKNPRYIYLMNFIIGFILLVALLATSYRFY